MRNQPLEREHCDVQMATGGKRSIYSTRRFALISEKAVVWVIKTTRLCSAIIDKTRDSRWKRLIRTNAKHEVIVRAAPAKHRESDTYPADERRPDSAQMGRRRQTPAWQTGRNARRWCSGAAGMARERPRRRTRRQQLLLLLLAHPRFPFSQCFHQGSRSCFTSRAECRGKMRLIIYMHIASRCDC
jgi:hypothetical protein